MRRSQVRCGTNISVAEARQWPKVPKPLPPTRTNETLSNSWDLVPHIRHNHPDFIITDNDKDFFRSKGYFTTKESIFTEEGLGVVNKALRSIYRGEITRASDSSSRATCPYEYDDWLKAMESSFRQRVLPEDVDRFGPRGPEVKGQVLKVNNSWWINGAIQQLLTNPAKKDQTTIACSRAGSVIGNMAADLLGVNEIRLWHDQAIVKPGGGSGGGSIGWHQDYAYWQPSSSPKMITALIMLQDTTEHNGCLQTIEGSHHWGLVYDEGDPGFFNPDLAAMEKKWKSLATTHSKGDQSWGIVHNPVKAGQVTFHHSLTFHGSGPNFSNLPRYALAIHMQSEECTLQLGRGTHHNQKDLGPHAEEGSSFDTAHFPLLFRRAITQLV